MTKIKLYHGDNLEIIKSFNNKTFQLIYIDPPYGAGKTFKSHKGSFDDKLTGKEFLDWLEPRLKEAKRLLSKDGSFFLQMDYREIHYVKVLCDKVFGRKNFMNEIIWAYDYGGRAKKRWSAKHDNILWYTIDPKHYTYNYDAIDRIPYMSPGLVGPEKAKKGKTPTDVWWNTIVPTNGKERTGYPTQKPLAIIERIIRVHSNADDEVLDFFAGSGTTGEAAVKHGRKVTLVDSNIEAIKVMKNRLKDYDVIQMQVSD